MFFLKFSKNFQNSNVKEQPYFHAAGTLEETMDYSRLNKEHYKFSNT